MDVTYVRLRERFKDLWDAKYPGHPWIDDAAHGDLLIEGVPIVTALSGACKGKGMKNSTKPVQKASSIMLSGQFYAKVSAPTPDTVPIEDLIDGNVIKKMKIYSIEVDDALYAAVHALAGPLPHSKDTVPSVFIRVCGNGPFVELLFEWVDGGASPGGWHCGQSSRPISSTFTQPASITLKSKPPKTFTKAKNGSRLEYRSDWTIYPMDPESISLASQGEMKHMRSGDRTTWDMGVIKHVLIFRQHLLEIGRHETKRNALRRAAAAADPFAYPTDALSTGEEPLTEWEWIDEVRARVRNEMFAHADSVSIDEETFEKGMHIMRRCVEATGGDLVAFDGAVAEINADGEARMEAVFLLREVRMRADEREAAAIADRAAHASASSARFDGVDDLVVKGSAATQERFDAPALVPDLQQSQ
jgi:hypothetical protein